MQYNKKVLLIGPIFHDYHTLIIEKMKKMGLDVVFFAEREYGLTFKVINNYFNKRLKEYQKKHYKKISTEINGRNFDYLFVIRGYMLPTEFLEVFRELNPLATLIMYQWDSDYTNPFSHLLRYFDKAFSFDFKDCADHSRLNYLPLFYSDDVSNLDSTKSCIKYDFFFMGWFFKERYQAALKFKDFAKKNNYNLKAFLYIPYTTYLKEKMKGTKLDREIISFKHMERTEYLKNLEQTSVMVDVSNPGQTGLAMRVIEALASNTKVLTNNKRIVEDNSIYNENFVFFIDDQMDLDPRILECKINSKKNLLSIEEWLKVIFLN